MKWLMRWLCKMPFYGVVHVVDEQLRQTTGKLRCKYCGIDLE